MEKIKVLFAASAVSIAIGGAFATKKDQSCAYYPQYRLYLNSYVLAGTEGINYFCFTGLGTCTYYKPTPWSDYLPCKAGLFIPVILANADSAASPTVGSPSGE